MDGSVTGLLQLRGALAAYAPDFSNWQGCIVAVAYGWISEITYAAKIGIVLSYAISQFGDGLGRPPANAGRDFGNTPDVIS